MKLKHTPGPWGLTGTRKQIICQVSELQSASIKGIIAEIWSDNEYDNKLIVAAPEMLEALIECLTDEDWQANWQANTIIKLIEKATGLPIDEVLSND